MKKVFKIVGIISLVVILAIAGVMTYLVSTIDLDQVKQQISSKVQEETGRELLIKGDLNLSVFPWIKFEIGETHFGNAAGFDGDFLSFSRAEASLKLMPLFSKQVEMNTLVFDDFTLNLYQNKDGLNNWDDLVKAEEDKSTEDTSRSEDTDHAGALALLVEGVEIRNANVSFQDDQAGSTMALTNFNLSAGQIGLQQDVPFTIDFKISLSEPKITGDHQIKGVANIDPDAGLVKVKELLLDAKLAASGLPVKTIALGVKTNLAFDMERQKLAVKPFDLETTLTGEGIPNQSAKLTVSTDITLDTRAMVAELKPLNIGIPGGTIQGDLAYAQKGQKQQIDFNLAADQIDVDRFIAPAPATATAGDNTEKKTSAKEIDGLRNLLVDGDLTIGKLIKDTLLVTDIAMHIKMRDGVLDISPMTARLYQGLASNRINVDLRGAAPQVKAELDLQGFQVGDYLQAAADKDVIEGTADVSANLRLTAADADTIMRSLNGTAAFNVSQGALKGINIPDMIRRARATLSGQAPPPASSQTTDFTELSGTTKITDGLVSNNDLSMKSPLLRVSGKGTANLPQEQVDYLVTTRLVASLSGQGGDDLQNLVGVPIPIRITGSFAEPDWKIDLKSALEEKVKSQAKDIVNEALKDPEKALQDPRKLLEGLKF